MDYRSGSRGAMPGHSLPHASYQPEAEPAGLTLEVLVDAVILLLILGGCVAAVILFACAAWSLWFGGWPL